MRRRNDGEPTSKIARRVVNARIGSYGKMVHRLARHESPVAHGRLCWWGVSLCDQWAGEARVTDEPVTCRGCLRAMGKVKR